MEVALGIILGDTGAVSRGERKTDRQRKVGENEKSPWGQYLTEPVPTTSYTLVS